MNKLLTTATLLVGFFCFTGHLCAQALKPMGPAHQEPETFLVEAKVYSLQVDDEESLPEAIQNTLDELSPIQIRVTGGLDIPRQKETTEYIKTPSERRMKPLASPQVRALLDRSEFLVLKTALDTSTGVDVLASANIMLDNTRDGIMKHVNERPFVSQAIPSLEDAEPTVKSSIKYHPRTQLLEAGTSLTTQVTKLEDGSLDFEALVQISEIQRITSISVGKNEKNGQKIELQFPELKLAHYPIEEKLKPNQQHLLAILGRTTLEKVEEAEGSMKMFRKPKQVTEHRMIVVLFRLQEIEMR